MRLTIHFYVQDVDAIKVLNTEFGRGSRLEPGDLIFERGKFNSRALLVDPTGGESIDCDRIAPDKEGLQRRGESGVKFRPARVLRDQSVQDMKHTFFSDGRRREQFGE